MEYLYISTLAMILALGAMTWFYISLIKERKNSRRLLHTSNTRDTKISYKTKLLAKIISGGLFGVAEDCAVPFYKNTSKGHIIRIKDKNSRKFIQIPCTLCYRYEHNNKFYYIPVDSINKEIFHINIPEYADEVFNKVINRAIYVSETKTNNITISKIAV